MTMFIELTELVTLDLKQDGINSFNNQVGVIPVSNSLFEVIQKSSSRKS